MLQATPLAGRRQDRRNTTRAAASIDAPHLGTSANRQVLGASVDSASVANVLPLQDSPTRFTLACFPARSTSFPSVPHVSTPAAWNPDAWNPET